MAVKPIISTITPWDSTLGTNISFSYSGNLPVRVRGVIRDASTLEIVWNKTKSVTKDSVTGLWKLFIEGNGITQRGGDGNGTKYCIQITCIDIDGNESSISDKAFFWCLAKPLFYYAEPREEGVIEASYVKLQLVYSQANGEALYTYRHFLYDNSKNILTMSNHYYNEDGLNYTFKGLDNKTSYYIRTQGTTRNGMVVDTGYVQIFTSYGEPETYSILQLSSDENATVSGMTNMICIDADEDAKDYIFLNSMVQLIKKKVTYQTNYTINRDFTLQIKITKLLYNGLLLKMYNKENPDCIITLDSYVFDDGTLRYCLKAFNGIATYVLYTDALNATDNDFMVITVRRINNVFSLYAQKVI